MWTDIPNNGEWTSEVCTRTRINDSEDTLLRTLVGRSTESSLSDIYQPGYNLGYRRLRTGHK